MMFMTTEGIITAVGSRGTTIQLLVFKLSQGSGWARARFISTDFLESKLLKMISSNFQQELNSLIDS